MSFEIVTREHKGSLFKIVTIEHKGLPSKIITMEHKGLGIIFFLLVFLNLRKLIFNCRKNSRKRMVMTWQLMWLNLSIATLNATLQFLVIYRFELFPLLSHCIPIFLPKFYRPLPQRFLLSYRFCFQLLRDSC